MGPEMIRSTPALLCWGTSLSPQDIRKLASKGKKSFNYFPKKWKN